jgi:hypothetical protein
MRLVAIFVCAVVLICIGAAPGHANKRMAPGHWQFSLSQRNGTSEHHE